MLHVNRGGEGFKRCVIKSVKRCQQTQILGHALRQSLRQYVILHGDRHVVAQQIECAQLFVVE